MKELIAKITSRKFIAFILVMGVGTAIDLHTDRGLSGNLLNLLMFLTAMYTTGNVVAKEVDRRRAASVQETAQETPVDPANDQYIQYLEAILESNRVTQQALSQIIERFNIKK
jgi:hypothetical protein